MREDGHNTPELFHNIWIPSRLEPLFTIGYEGISIYPFTKWLVREDITMLYDVRANPKSRKEGFSKFDLQRLLAGYEIEYIHNPRLGIPTDLRKTFPKSARNQLLKYYDDEILANRPTDLHYLKYLITREYRIALMCFERKPSECHRSVLAEAIKKSFVTTELEVIHVGP